MKSILILSPGGWSETVLSSFVAPALKLKHPEAKITLALDQTLADWTPCLHFDDLILLKKNRLSWVTFLKLRWQPFDLAINLDRFESHRRILRAAGIKNIVENVKPPTSLSEVDRVWEILARLDYAPSKLNFKLKVRRHVHHATIDRLAKSRIQPRSFLVLAPGAGIDPQEAPKAFLHKRWPFFTEFIKLACERFSGSIILLGDSKEKEFISSLVPIGAENIFEWAGSTTREEALAVIGEAAAFVGVDSGPAHVAGSVGIPTVILYGPSSSQTRKPPNPGGKVLCLSGTVPCSPCQQGDGQFDWKCADNVCMKAISPEKVWQALNQIPPLKTV